MDIEGKAALITGGGTGVGRATALMLAERGCSVLVNYSRSREDADKTAAEAQALGVKALAWQADVAGDAACRGMVDAAVKEFGRLDVLVNSAGTTVFVPHPDLEGLSGDDFSRIYDVNVKGPFFCTRAARAALTASGSAEVVNVSSVAGIAAIGSSIAYACSKAALNNLTISLARALGPEIRVNAICPGAIQGRWLAGGLGEAYDAVMEGTAAVSPLKKVATPDDIGQAIVAVITGSDLMTGQLITVDGGMLIRG
jgi:3-oxoacyl-[acyl-carrier protein] reductase